VKQAAWPHKHESDTIMIYSKRLADRSETMSDTILDGLFSGVAAGVAMAAYLVVWGLAVGKGPAEILGMFDPNGGAVAAVGALMHLAVAAVYGILFGLFWWLARRIIRRSIPAVAAGVVYGLALLIAAKVVVVPAADSTLAAIPVAHFALAHVIYGVVLGYLSERMGARAA
jgi:hypothetical protein